MNPLFENVITLNKVGPKSCQALNQLGVYRVCDLLHYYPRDYENAEAIKLINDLRLNEVAFIKGRIVSSVNLMKFGKNVMVQCFIDDSSGRLKLDFFNQP